jgi:hypothetical protein
MRLFAASRADVISLLVTKWSLGAFHGFEKPNR